MDDLFSKYKQLLLQNEELSIELQKQKTKNTLLQEELNMIHLQGKPTMITDDSMLELKKKVTELENVKKELKETKRTLSEQEINFREYFTNNRKYTVGLLGYQMEMTNEKIELLSMYAFDPEDKFVFSIVDGGLELLSNDFAEGYKTDLEEFMIKGRSIPAFLARVTLDLWNQKTFN